MLIVVHDLFAVHSCLESFETLLCTEAVISLALIHKLLCVLHVYA